MVQAILSQLLDRVRPLVQEAEAFYLTNEDTPIEFENNRLKSLQTKASQGIALRVRVNDRVGFASTTDVNRLEELIDAAIQTAEIGEEATFSFASDNSSYDDLHASTFQPPSFDKLVGVGEKLIEGLRSYNSEIMVSADFHIRSVHKALATTGGTFSQQQRQVVSCTLGGNLVQGEDFLQIYDYEVVREGEPDYDAILERVIQKYRWAEQITTIESGAMPVLFTPRAVASVIGGLFNTVLSGQSVAQKASPLADKVGEKLFDQRLTVYEDPTIGVSACPVDDEGTPTQKKTFIDRGVVQGFYWDRKWAAKMGRSSTGNGFRSGLSRPTPATCNLCFVAGDVPYTDLRRKMAKGLIVEQVLGAGQSNQLAGEFSVNLALGYKVVDGEIVGRVKNTMVASSIFEAFNQMIDMSSERELVGGNSLIPAILFDRIGVASKG
ncbi:MAG: metallopeptidase TldD-related protein [Pseudanabaenaceae cyanobacterium SKYGB_i_bin29]|nr:TldD/PmbA family protein [Pseudanabaenaceae cyanobacterium SKYG29]MDW8421531.1 metallopeptidase TldD-related protein [Pseudanabaenaceae cyanobacterium SKYGB_i_bin29]